jgi:plasmid stabilization system protein ParE
LQIIFESGFSTALFSILQYISKDKKSAAIKLKQDLKLKIDLLSDSPFMCRASIYFKDERYRDLIFKGYTVVYKVEDEQIKILDIFKYINKS